MTSEKPFSNIKETVSIEYKGQIYSGTYYVSDFGEGLCLISVQYRELHSDPEKIGRSEFYMMKVYAQNALRRLVIESLSKDS